LPTRVCPFQLSLEFLDPFLLLVAVEIPNEVLQCINFLSARMLVAVRNASTVRIPVCVQKAQNSDYRTTAKLELGLQLLPGGGDGDDFSVSGKLEAVSIAAISVCTFVCSF
jgi:hypothetical protein